MSIFQRKDKDQDIELNTKNIALRTVLFVLALAVAVGAFAYGVAGMGHKDAGIYEVEAEPDESLPLYGGEMTLKYRFRGSSNEIRAQLNEVRSVYSAALKRAYIYFDARTAREGWTNLASLNEAPGQDVRLEPEVFAALLDAYELTKRQEGYNLFAGALYSAWLELLYLEEPETMDPLNDAQTRARLERVAAVVNDPGQFNLEIVDKDRCVVRFSYSDAVRDLLAEYELGQTALDLNVLRDAFELRYIAATLEERGWHEGYLTTHTGLALALSGYGEGEYCLYGRVENDAVSALKADSGAGSAFSQVRVFPYYEGEYGFYSVGEGAAEVRRHPYLTTTGAYPGALESSCVLAPDGDVVAARWENLRLNACATATEAETLARASARPIAWIVPGEEKTVHVNAAGEGILKPDADYGFRAANG